MNTTDYQEQALSFLRNTGTTIRIKFAEVQTPASWATGRGGYKYEVTLNNRKGQYTFDFWGSIANRQAGKRPTKYDVLACLDVYEGSLDDFVADFGYDDVTKVTDTIKTYNAVIDQSLQLQRIFTPSQIRQLQEIA